MREEKFRVVSAMDPALDLTITETLKYVADRDFATLRFTPGVKPMIFHVREVPHGLWESFVRSAGDGPERYHRAFRAGVERVENLVQRDGTAIQSWAPAYRHPSMRDVVMLSEEEANAMFSPSEREEIGSVVYHHSFLPLRIKCTFPLLPSLQEVLVTRTYRPVGANPSSAEDPSNAKPSEFTAQSPVATASV